MKECAKTITDKSTQGREAIVVVVLGLSVPSLGERPAWGKERVQQAGWMKPGHPAWSHHATLPTTGLPWSGRRRCILSAPNLALLRGRQSASLKQVSPQALHTQLDE